MRGIQFYTPGMLALVERDVAMKREQAMVTVGSGQYTLRPEASIEMPDGKIAYRKVTNRRKVGTAQFLLGNVTVDGTTYVVLHTAYLLNGKWARERFVALHSGKVMLGPEHLDEWASQAIETVKAHGVQQTVIARKGQEHAQ